MLRGAFAVSFLLLSSPVLADSPTNFGIRPVGGAPVADTALMTAVPGKPLSSGGGFLSTARVDMADATRIGARWGRVTSTYRSPAHNRRVGGVPNSFHLSGRAIDIARRPGVTHAMVAAAFRNAGYHLIESLDEIDHSHFAFGGPGSGGGSLALARLDGPRPRLVRENENGKTIFRMVFAPPSGGN